MTTTPKILFTEEVWRKLHALVEVSTLECSMLGEVETKDNMLMITKLHIPKQTRSAAYTEITQDGIFELLGQEGVDPAKIKAWFHSHVNMGVTPSLKDESQIKELMQDAEWFIRGIWNKRGEYSLSIHWMGCQFDAIPQIAWTTSVDKEALKKELEDKTIIPTHNYQSTTFPLNDYSQFGIFDDNDEWTYHKNGRYNKKTRTWEEYNRSNQYLTKPIPTYANFAKNNKWITGKCYAMWKKATYALTYDEWIDKYYTSKLPKGIELPTNTTALQTYAEEYEDFLMTFMAYSKKPKSNI